VAARNAWEAERRAAGIVERVERLRAQPELVLDRLAETCSVWNGADIEREVRSALGVRSGHDAQIAAGTRAVVGASLAIDTDAYTIDRVVSERAGGVRGGGDTGRSQASGGAARAGCAARRAAARGVRAAGRQTGPSDRDGDCRRGKVAAATRRRRGVHRGRVPGDRHGGGGRCGAHAGGRSGDRHAHRRAAARGSQDRSRSVRPAHGAHSRRGGDAWRRASASCWNGRGMPAPA
jgi:hypothetical protein